MCIVLGCFEDGSYGDPEIILNQNELKERYPYVSIPIIKMSPSRRVRYSLLEYSGDCKVKK